jgi:hypothetical protein
MKSRVVKYGSHLPSCENARMKLVRELPRERHASDRDNPRACVLRTDRDILMDETCVPKVLSFCLDDDRRPTTKEDSLRLTSFGEKPMADVLTQRRPPQQKSAR